MRTYHTPRKPLPRMIPRLLPVFPNQHHRRNPSKQTQENPQWGNCKNPIQIGKREREITIRRRWTHGWPMWAATVHCQVLGEPKWGFPQRKLGKLRTWKRGKDQFRGKLWWVVFGEFGEDSKWLECEERREVKRTGVCAVCVKRKWNLMEVVGLPQDKLM